MWLQEEKGRKCIGFQGPFSLPETSSLCWSQKEGKRGRNPGSTLAHRFTTRLRQDWHQLCICLVMRGRASLNLYSRHLFYIPLVPLCLSCFHLTSSVLIYHLPAATTTLRTTTMTPDDAALFAAAGFSNPGSSSGLQKAKLLFSVLWCPPSRNMGQVLENIWGRFSLTLSSALRLNPSISMLSLHKLPGHLRNALADMKSFVPLMFSENQHYYDYLPSTFYVLGTLLNVQTCAILLIFTTTLWDCYNDYSRSTY